MTTLLNYVNLIIQIILAIGVFILFWQVKTQVIESRYDRTLAQLQILETPDFFNIRLYVLREWDGKLPLNRDDELRIRDFLHRMEMLGVLYLKKYIDRELIIDLYAPFIVYSWHRCKPFIEKEMSDRKEAKYAEHFRIMHLHTMESFNKKYPDRIITIPEDVFPTSRNKPLARTRNKSN